MKSRLFVMSTALMSLIPSAAYADITGFVNGTVTIDAKPAAGVTVTIAGVNASQTVVTDAHGVFRFPRVNFGAYTLAGSTDGFAASLPIVVSSGSVVPVKLNLSAMKEIGSVRASVATVARGPASSPVAVTILDRRAIAALPANQSLDQLIATAPGISTFAYGEPIAHGFHGITYAIDGVPIPQASSANLSEVIDPRNIDSMEVFTGSIPAEYGGERQGAVVNIATIKPAATARTQSGYLTVGLGTYGLAQTSLADRIALSKKTQVYFNANIERSNRGLDSPTFEPNHDRANQSNVFLRSVTDLGNHATLAASYLGNSARYQVPINTNPNDPNNPVSSPANTDDVQVEHDQLLSLAYTKTAADGKSYSRIVPWIRTNTVRYLGDTANNLAGQVNNDDGTTSPLNSLSQDRSSTYTGLRLEHFRLAGAHAFKAGLDGAVEQFSGTSRISFIDANNAVQAFDDNAAQRGSNVGAYVQDKWSPTPFVTVFSGLRYDRSSGFTAGSQLSPRLEVNGKVGRNDILHGYYGRQYAAPYLEDTRRAAVVLAGTGAATTPVYDLKPERDSFVEFGIAHTMSEHSRWYVNLWKRDVNNVLDTTSLAQTPIQAVFNNTVGMARGIEFRLEGKSERGDSAFISATVAQSQAGGVNGSTFLFCPPPVDASCAAANGDITLQPEDHDQTIAVNANYTKRLGSDLSYFASLSPQYGTGYPVEFQNGQGRLPNHLTIDMALGRDPGKGSGGHLGYQLTLANLTNRNYLIKVNNGFNTTQYAAGFRADLRITKPF